MVVTRSFYAEPKARTWIAEISTKYRVLIVTLGFDSMRCYGPIFASG